MMRSGRRRSGPDGYWHAAPLHFLPRLLETGELRCSDRLPAGVRARPTALRRRRQLGLTGYLHLSLAPSTPLLADKRRKGYSHVLLEFPAAVGNLPGAAFLPYNTKRWAHREAFRPVAGEGEKTAFLEAWRGGDFPSAELLIPGSLALAHAVALCCATDVEAEAIADLVDGLGLAGPPLRLAPDLFPGEDDCRSEATMAYFAACRAAGAVLDPPALPFD